MAVPYERIVGEDFNLGYGSVDVSMPAGGTAVGSRVGIHTFLPGSISMGDFGTDATAMATAFAAVPDGGTLRFVAGTYVLAGATQLALTGKSIEIVFDHGAVLDATQSTVGVGLPVLTIGGTVGAYTVLGASPAAGDRTLTVSAGLAATLREGDLVRLTTAPLLGGAGTTWRSLGSTNWKGEIVEVLSVSGTTVSLKNNLADSYTAADTVACRMAPIRVRLQNFTMRGNLSAKNIGLQLQYLKDLLVTGGSITGCGHTCLTVNYAAHATIHGYAASNDWISGVGNNYGLMIYSSQDVSVSGSPIYGGRHAITTGGAEPNRSITIGPGNTIDTDRAAQEYSLSPHDNTDGFHVFGNYIKGGVLCGNATNVVIEDNIVSVASVVLGGIVIAKDAAVDDESVIIRNNVITVQDSVAGAVALLSVSGSGTTAKTIKTVIIRGNDVRGANTGVAVLQTGTGALTIKDLDVAHNTITGTSTRRPFQIGGAGDTTRLTVQTARVLDNIVTGADTTLFSHFACNVTDYTLERNTFHHTGAGGGSPVSIVTSVTLTRMRFSHNILKNDVAEADVQIAAGDYLAFTGNTLDNMTTNGGVTISATDVLYRDNYPTSTVAGLVSVTGRPVPIARSAAASAFTKTADTTLANVPGLVARVVAGRVYRFVARLHQQADTTGGHKYAIGGTATAFAVLGDLVAVDLTAKTIPLASRLTALGSSAGEASGINYFVTIAGLIRVNAGGTLTVQFAQNVASGSSILLGYCTWDVTEVP